MSGVSRKPLGGYPVNNYQHLVQQTGQLRQLQLRDSPWTPKEKHLSRVRCQLGLEEDLQVIRNVPTPKNQLVKTLDSSEPTRQEYIVDQCSINN